MRRSRLLRSSIRRVRWVVGRRVGFASKGVGGRCGGGGGGGGGRGEVRFGLLRLCRRV